MTRTRSSWTCIALLDFAHLTLGAPLRRSRLPSLLFIPVVFASRLLQAGSSACSASISDMSEGALDLFRQRAKLMFESSPQSHCRTETVETWSGISLSLASRPLKLHKWPPKLPTSNLELAVVLLSLVEVPEPRSSSIFLNGSIIRTSYFPGVSSRTRNSTRNQLYRCSSSTVGWSAYQLE